MDLSLEVTGDNKLVSLSSLSFFSLLLFSLSSLLLLFRLKRERTVEEVDLEGRRRVVGRQREEDVEARLLLLHLLFLFLFGDDDEKKEKWIND